MRPPARQPRSQRPPPLPDPGPLIPALWDSVVVQSLWSSLCGDDLRALRACCTPLRDAVDAQVNVLDQGPSGGAHVLSAATCARLGGVNKMTLRTMACVRAMLVDLPCAFPWLLSVRLLLHKKGDGVVKEAADYQAVASTAPWLTQLSVQLPASATTLPQHMASLLSVCSKLEDLTLDVHDESKPVYMQQVSSLSDVDALAAAGPLLLSLQLPSCSSLANLEPLRALGNLQSLDISHCIKVSDLAPLGTVANLQSLNISSCYRVSDLTPLGALVNLQSLDISRCIKVSDLAALRSLVNLQRLDTSRCDDVSDLSPLGALVNLQSLDISGCDGVSNVAFLGALVSLHSLRMRHCNTVSDLAPLVALVKLQSLNIDQCRLVSDLAPLQSLVNLQSLDMSHCANVSNLDPLGALVKLEKLVRTLTAAGLPVPPPLQSRIERGELRVQTT
ncbi:hypothetical protein FOA52_007818 [Chlamydomonas sp. UWO 241]|nr:hypothetical protein FOA52_007818 [Chlamydomonas sp. UWO 241]